MSQNPPQTRSLPLLGKALSFTKNRFWQWLRHCQLSQTPEALLKTDPVIDLNRKRIRHTICLRFGHLRFIVRLDWYLVDFRICVEIRTILFYSKAWNFTKNGICHIFQKKVPSQLESQPYNISWSNSTPFLPPNYWTCFCFVG